MCRPTSEDVQLYIIIIIRECLGEADTGVRGDHMRRMCLEESESSGVEGDPESCPEDSETDVEGDLESCLEDSETGVEGDPES